MACSTEQISAYIDGELNRQESDSVKVHIKNCKECATVYGELLNVVGILHDLDEVELPEGFHDKIMKDLRGHERKPSFFSGLLNWKYYSTAAAFVFIVVLMYSVGHNNATNESASSHENSIADNGYTETGNGGGASESESLISESDTNDLYSDESVSDDSMSNEFALSDLSSNESMSKESYQDNAIENEVMAEEESNLARTFGFPESAPMQSPTGTGEGFDIKAFSSQAVMADEPLIPKDCDIVYVEYRLSANDYEEFIFELNAKIDSQRITDRYLSNNGNYNSSSINYSLEPAEIRNVVEFIENNSYIDIVNKTEHKTSVRADLIDIRARLNSKQQEQSRLLELLQKAATLTEIIAIENKLSMINGQIDQYATIESDNLYKISHPTLRLIIEFPDDNSITLQSDNFSGNIKTTFITSINITGQIVTKFIVFVTYISLPCVLIMTVYMTVRFIKNRRRK